MNKKGAGDDTTSLLGKRVFDYSTEDVVKVVKKIKGETFSVIPSELLREQGKKCVSE